MHTIAKVEIAVKCLMNNINETLFEKERKRLDCIILTRIMINKSHEHV